MQARGGRIVAAHLAHASMPLCGAASRAAKCSFSTMMRPKFHAVACMNLTCRRYVHQRYPDLFPVMLIA